MSNPGRNRKVISIGDQGETPAVVLARTMEKVANGDVAAVIVGIVWTDDRGSAIDWSRMTYKDFSFIARMVGLQSDDMLRAEWDTLGDGPKESQ